VTRTCSRAASQRFHGLAPLYNPRAKPATAVTPASSTDWLWADRRA